jgi:hypothetical protein
MFYLAKYNFTGVLGGLIALPTFLSDIGNPDPALQGLVTAI